MYCKRSPRPFKAGHAIFAAIATLLLASGTLAGAQSSDGDTYESTRTGALALVQDPDALTCGDIPDAPLLVVDAGQRLEIRINASLENVFYALLVRGVQPFLEYSLQVVDPALGTRTEVLSARASQPFEDDANPRPDAATVAFIGFQPTTGIWKVAQGGVDVATLDVAVIQSSSQPFIGFWEKECPDATQNPNLPHSDQAPVRLPGQGQAPAQAWTPDVLGLSQRSLLAEPASVPSQPIQASNQPDGYCEYGSNAFLQPRWQEMERVGPYDNEGDTFAEIAGVTNFYDLRVERTQGTCNSRRIDTLSEYGVSTAFSIHGNSAYDADDPYFTWHFLYEGSGWRDPDGRPVVASVHSPAIYIGTNDDVEVDQIQGIHHNRGYCAELEKRLDGLADPIELVMGKFLTKIGKAIKLAVKVVLKEALEPERTPRTPRCSDDISFLEQNPHAWVHDAVTCDQPGEWLELQYTEWPADAVRNCVRWNLSSSHDPVAGGFSVRFKATGTMPKVYVSHDWGGVFVWDCTRYGGWGCWYDSRFIQVPAYNVALFPTAH